MPTPDPTESLLDGDLDIEHRVYNGKTMSVRHVKRGGKLRFNNKDGERKLLIMSPAGNPPFVLSEGSTPVSWFEVRPEETKFVWISPLYGDDSWFTYTAIIDGSTAEDPVVIVDRR